MSYPRDLACEMVYYRPGDTVYARAQRWLSAYTGRLAFQPSGQENSIPGLERYLDAYGVGRYFNIDEITGPRDKEKAEGCGYVFFVPPVHTFPLLASAVALADILRGASGAPVTMRNSWRPQSYNSAVSSSGIDSDHPNACAVDLDFSSEAAHAKALAVLNGIAYVSGRELQLSVGIGAITLHVGVLSPRGARFWTYDSFKGAVPAGLSGLGSL